MPRNSQAAPAKMRLVQTSGTAEQKNTKKQITYQSILDETLLGLAEGVQALRDIIRSPESEKKEVIAAVNAMTQVSIKIAEAQVTHEHLPLLQQLEKSVNSK